MSQLSRAVAFPLALIALLLFLSAIPAWLGVAGILSPPSTEALVRSMLKAAAGFILLGAVMVLGGMGPETGEDSFYSG